MRQHNAFCAPLGLLLVISIFLTGCSGTPVPADRQAYVGQWEGLGMSLTITPDGGIAYERLKGSGTTTVNAPLKRFEGDNFVAGVLFMTTTFEVQQPPHQDGDTWKMTVDGVELTKIAGPSP